MQLSRRKPPPPLDQFVQALWLFDSGPQTSSPVPPHAKERALPDGCLQLIVNLREDRHRIYDSRSFHLSDTLNGCLVVGPHSEFSVIDTAAHMVLAGVHFKPGGAYPFMAPPPHELHGLQVPLDALWGRFAAELRDRLLQAVTPEDRFQVMEQALLARACRSLMPHPAVQFAIQQMERGPSTHTIAAVTRQTGFSPRHFIELFRRQVGLTPKLFCRVRRFQHALQSIASARPVAWTDVALDAGYFDQAHFIHDFRAFSGLTPSAYRESRPCHRNHVPLDHVT